MRNPKRYLPHILRIELNDLLEDREYFMDEVKADLENGKITEPVFLEYQALFENEVSGIREFYNFLEKTEIEQFEDLDSMIIFIKYHFREIAKTYNLAGTVIIHIEQSIDKVKQYILQPSGTIQPGGKP